MKLGEAPWTVVARRDAHVQLEQVLAGREDIRERDATHVEHGADRGTADEDAAVAAAAEKPHAIDGLLNGVGRDGRRVLGREYQPTMQRRAPW